VSGQQPIALKRRAARRGRNMEAEVRDILRHTVQEGGPPEGLGTRIVRRFAGKGFDFEAREWHGEQARPAKFKK
jgi:plasmid stability protein